MNIISSTKNISESYNGYGVIISVQGIGERWLATYEEDEDRNILLSSPIKVMHQQGENKEFWKAYAEHNVTNELIKMLDKVCTLFDNSPVETKRVLAF